MPFGGYHPSPLRFGGGRGSRLERIVESLQAGRGAAYAQDTTGATFVENQAFGRVVDRDMYGVNERLANQFLPTGMTADGLLPRWEAIFGLTPAASDTEATRRARVAAQWALIGQANSMQPVHDACSAALGAAFVGISYVTPANCLSWWPGLNGNGGSVTSTASPPLAVFVLGGYQGTGSSFTIPTSGGLYGARMTISNAANSTNNGTWPISTQASTTSVNVINANAVATDYGVGGTIGSPTIVWSITNPSEPWFSTIAHLDIQVQVPTGYTLGQFYAALGAMNASLESIMPAWATWDWWLPSPSGGGGMGFYLDDNTNPPNNLDTEVFDV